MVVSKKEKKIFLAGHGGMVGSALYRQLVYNGISSENIITKDRVNLDLVNQEKVLNFFKKNQFSEVYLAAAKVGGIAANEKFSAEFLYENLMIQSNVINSAFKTDVKKLLFLGSSCIYPKVTKDKIEEDYLLSGPLEETNEAYSIAKIAGLKLCQYYTKQFGIKHNIDYRSVMPTNLYGPGDNYHPTNSHVISGLISRFHDAKVNNKKEVFVWGSGLPLREFLHVDDLASACIFIMNLNKEIFYNSLKVNTYHINVGYGLEITIRDLAFLIAEIVCYDGQIRFDKTKPDGVFSKLLNSSIINKLGWKPKIKLKEGLKMSYSNFLKNQKHRN